MRARLALPVSALLLAGALVGWNASRFIGAEARIRTKELSFLPSPMAARLACAGHANTLAKLRWIDSFAYFQLILDRKDDTITATGEHAYERLFDMLLSLDPHFIEYYNNAVLNVGAILGRQGKVLSILNRGLLENPHERTLWRQFAVLLLTTYRLEERNPLSMDAVLEDWAAHETDEAGRQMVWDWKAAMARRVPRGLEQAPYWLEQLSHAKPGSPTHAFITATLREQVARWSEAELAALGAAPLPGGGLGIDPAAVARRYPHGIPPLAPVARRDDGGMAVRSDPFGQPYVWQDGAPISLGWAFHKAEVRANGLSARLAALATREKRWPATISELALLGETIPPAPPGAAWRIDGQRVVCDHPAPPAPPWDFSR